MLKNTYNKCLNKNVCKKKKCLKKYLLKKNFCSTKIYQKHDLKYKIPSIYFKNSAGIKWPFEVDMR